MFKVFLILLIMLLCSPLLIPLVLLLIKNVIFLIVGGIALAAFFGIVIALLPDMFS